MCLPSLQWNSPTVLVTLLRLGAAIDANAISSGGVTVSLSSILSDADVVDLDVLTDYITDKGAGRLTLDGDVCKRLMRCKRMGIYTGDDRELIGKEIRAFGGNSLVNLFRGQGVKYRELVTDVANHLKVNFPKGAQSADMEEAIVRKIFADSVVKMSANERQRVLDALDIGELSGLGPVPMGTAIAAARMGGFATYQMALAVANGIARALIDRGLTIATNAAISRVIGIAIGPVGWVITGLWTLADLGSPAYRVTVPCVVQVAYMRLKARATPESQTCLTDVRERPPAKKAAGKKAVAKVAVTTKAASKKVSAKKVATAKKTPIMKPAAKRAALKKTVAKSR